MDSKRTEQLRYPNGYTKVPTKENGAEQQSVIIVNNGDTHKKQGKDEDSSSQLLKSNVSNSNKQQQQQDRVKFNNNEKKTKDKKSSAAKEKTGFERRMGLWSVVSYLIGGIIGTGIFISPTGVLEHAGSPGSALLVWVSCGLVATLAALCFAELGTSFPNSGSSYYYVKLAFGDFAAFVFEWVDIILRKSTTSCVRYLTFSIYFLQPFYGLCKPCGSAVRLVAAVAMIFLAYINVQGVQFRSGFQIVTTCAKLVAMALIFGLGVYYLYADGTNYLTNSFRGSITSPGSIAMAFSYGLYAYSGWDVMNTAVEEIKNPNVTLPLAILISMIVVTLAYTLVNIAYFLVLDVSDILDSNAVATVFATNFTSTSAWLVSILVSISAIGSCNAIVFQTSRYCYACARESQLPKFMAGLSRKHNSPQPAIFVMTCLTILCLAAKDINQLLVYYGILKWSMVALPIAAQIYLRFKYPNLKRPLKLPLFIPVLTLTIMLGLLVIPVYQNWFNSLIATLLCFVCVPIYLFFFAWRNKPKALEKTINKIDDGLALLCQKLMLVDITIGGSMVADDLDRFKI